MTASGAPTESEYNSLTFSISSAEAGERLDAFLASRITGWSRARLQRLVEDAAVLVNGRISKSAYRLHPKDEIEVELTSPLSDTFLPEEIRLDIVHEDDAVIVVNKPAGLVVHPAAGISSGTLANALTFHFQHLPNVGGVTRPGIVHRLDKGTSGLLVIAKTEKAHEDLSDQFRARSVFKSYVALVHGQVEPAQGKIDQPIARDPRHRTRMAVVRSGRPALSIYRVRQHFERFSLLDVELKTGRTHQIRVHLAWLKHPVAGDGVYGAGRDKVISDSRIRAAIAGLHRQFLHAEKLGFRHPVSGEEMVFEAPIPTELRNVLETIQSQ